MEVRVGICPMDINACVGRISNKQDYYLPNHIQPYKTLIILDVYQNKRKLLNSFIYHTMNGRKHLPRILESLTISIDPASVYSMD